METSINWREWGKEPFRLAEILGRPILLSISAVWCHWCHVMDKTTYSDKEVTQIINSSFVPIRVDTDKRPDINRRYNMGGWPTTAFLTSRGEVLTGGTYIPPEPMRQLLKKISQFYHQNREILVPSVPSLRPRLKQKTLAAARQSKLSLTVVEEVLQSLKKAFDSTYGGFGREPKFPLPEALSFLIAQGNLREDKDLLTMATKTLDEMPKGEIFDQEEGGFFRYATTRDWRNPHYEKLLEDNAKLLMVYLQAFEAGQNLPYRRVAESILSYVEATLRRGDEGGFYGSQDADEEYYKLNLKERKEKTPPRVDTTIYTDWNALTISAYLKAAIVLDREELRDYALKTLSFIWKNCYRLDLGMYHYHLKGKAHLPGVLADQVLTALCLLDAYEATGKKEFIRQTEELVKLIQKNLGDKEEAFFDLPEDPKALGHLRERDKPILDNSLAAEMLIRLYHLTGEERYLASAEGCLKIFEGSYKDYGLEATSYVQAVNLFFSLSQGTEEVELGEP